MWVLFCLMGRFYKSGIHNGENEFFIGKTQRGKHLREASGSGESGDGIDFQDPGAIGTHHEIDPGKAFAVGMSKGIPGGMPEGVRNGVRKNIQPTGEGRPDFGVCIIKRCVGFHGEDWQDMIAGRQLNDPDGGKDPFDVLFHKIPGDRFVAGLAEPGV
jgi:hypothetical protein